MTRPAGTPGTDPADAPAPSTVSWREALLVQGQHLLDAVTGSVTGSVAGSVASGEAGHVAALHLDLTGFGALNTSLGHRCGDLLLEEIDRDLRDTLRQGDLFARGSGDEFVVVSATGVSGAVALARRLLEAVGRPRQVDGHRLTLTACVGVAVGTAGATLHPAAAPGPLSPDRLLQHADTALGQAKRVGPRSVQVFAPGAARDGGRHLELLADLAAAPADGSLRLRYQPIVELATGRTVRREALLRWEHDGQLRTPDEFLALAETHGLMRDIGTWVLRRACQDAAGWVGRGDACGVTVNLAAAQITQDLPGQVDAALAASGLPASLLSVEVTETSVLADVDLACAVLDALDERGVRVLLDDFGTGFSSLSHLARLPVHGIKLDRSFVAALPRSREHAVVAALAQIGAALGVVTIAEGVETDDQRRLLSELGYTHGQGWLFGRPAPAGELAEADPRPADHDVLAAPAARPLPTAGELLADLVQHSHDAILTKGLDGTIWSWNPAAERLYGWSAAEILGRSVHLIVPPHHQHEVDDIIAAVRRGDRVERHDAERVTKHGRRVVVNLSVSPLRDAAGTVIGAAAIAHDVTAERLAEAELEHRRQDEHRRGQLLGNLVQHSHDAILTKGVDGTVWSWNPAAERLYGWTAEEIVGRKVHLIAPPHRHEEIDQILVALRAGETVERHDTERVTKDGRKVLVNLSVSPLHDEAGRVIGAAAIAHDVTAERMAAVELEHRTRQEAAARHLRELGELAGTIAHDVNNSLGAILMTTAALRRGLPPALAVDHHPVAELLDQLEDVTESTGDLLAALGRYARAEAQDRSTCLVDAVLAELLPVLARLAGPQRHLRCLSSVGAATVGVSRAELDTVLINLVTNAVHAIDGEGTITISTDVVAADHAALAQPAGVVHARAAGTGATGRGPTSESDDASWGLVPLPGRLVRLRVTDTGCGMEESVRRRAFQPLFSTRRRTGGARGSVSGSGLGLASVHRIVTTAGGQASITSSPGHGTSVELLLPVLDGGATATGRSGGGDRD